MRKYYSARLPELPFQNRLENRNIYRLSWRAFHECTPSAALDAAVVGVFQSPLRTKR